jgi:hypothetical protein
MSNEQERARVLALREHTTVRSDHYRAQARQRDLELQIAQAK